MAHDEAAALHSLTGLLDDWLAFQRWYRQVPSMVVGMSIGDETVFTGAYGYADIDGGVPATSHTRYRIASHSKVFTTTAIMQLVEDGRLRLDDPVARHLEWFRDSAGDSELAHVTIRHLLCHASGITRDGATTHWYDDRFPEVDEIVRQVDSLTVFPTVDRLKYSNVAFTLAGLVVEAVTGRPYEEHVTAAILDPLGLAATTPDLPADLAEHACGYPSWFPGRERRAIDHVRANAMNSATGFSSNVHDLLRWYQAHRFGSGELLHDRSKREMQRVQFEGPDTRWGLGFSIVEHGGLAFATHGGGYPGFITYSGVEQRHGIALVVLTSSTDGPARAVFDGIAKLVAQALEGRFDGQPPFDAATADRLAGFYEDRWAITQVARVGAKLVVLSPVPQDPTATLSVLDHIDDLTFRYPNTFPIASPGELVRFEPGRPPRMHAPSAPPVERSQHLFDA